MLQPAFLVRHTGVTLVEGLAPGEWPASPEGVEAAERLASADLFAGATAVASSPEAKAVATAEPFARRLGLDVSLEPALREVERPRGPIVSSDELARWVAAYLEGVDLDGWEPIQEAKHRVTACIDRLRREVDGPCVVVSHGLLLTLYRGDAAGLWKTMPLPAVAVARGAEIGPWLSLADVVGES